MLLILLSGAACGACSGPPTASSFSMPRVVVDLSPTIGEDAPVATIGRKFLRDFSLPESTTFHHVIVDTPFYAADSRLELLNHVGPHHDAPSHMIEGARTTDQFPLESFLGPARILDFRAKPRDRALSRADFEGAGIQAGDIVIAFVGYAPPTSPDEYPSYAYLSGEAAEYLATLPIKLFATDMPSLAGLTNLSRLIAEGRQGSAGIAPEHYAVLSRDIPSVEGLVNLNQVVDEKSVVFVGFPLKIRDGNAGPMRAAALVY
jgi:kynurenine formamidase